MMTASDDKIDFTNYTLDKYNAIVKWKTAFYSFYLPVASAMYMVSEIIIYFKKTSTLTS